MGKSLLVIKADIEPVFYLLLFYTFQFYSIYICSYTVVNDQISMGNLPSPQILHISHTRNVTKSSVYSLADIGYLLK